MFYSKFTLYFAEAYVEGETYSLTVRVEGRWNGPSYKYKIVNKVQRAIFKYREVFLKTHQFPMQKHVFPPDQNVPLSSIHKHVQR